MSSPFDVPLDDLRRRTSIKWRLHEDDVLPLWVAETDVSLAEPVVRAVHDVLSRGDTGYAAPGVLAEAVAGFASRRWGWEVPLERTVLVPDVMIGVFEVLRLVTGTGDAVVVTPPVYPPFFDVVRHAERRVVEAPLGADGRLDLDVLGEAFEHARADGGRAAFLLCNPHNPTGVAHTADELSGLARLADQHGVTVVSDEIHGALVHGDARFVPYLSLDGTGTAFALTSASKAFNLAGLKAAVAVAGEEAGATLATMPEIVGHGASHVAVHAQVAAFTEGDAWLDGLLTALAENRRHLEGLLASTVPAVHWVPPDATFLAWLDCRDLGLGDDPAAAFLERGRVALNSGLDFGAPGAGHARLNFGTSTQVLDEAVRRMAVALP